MANIWMVSAIVAFVWASPVGADPYVGQRAFRANLHSHSIFSDDIDLDFYGTRDTPANAFAEARKNGLAVMALTDHAELLTPHAASTDRNGAPARLPSWDVGSVSPCQKHFSANEWNEIEDAARIVTDTNFVALRGFEWSADGGQDSVKLCGKTRADVLPAPHENIGHINVIGTRGENYVAHHYLARGQGQWQKDSLQSLFDWVTASAPGEPDMICQFNHPNLYAREPFDQCYNSPPAPAVRDAFALIELNSHHGPLERGGNWGHDMAAPEKLFRKTSNVAIWQRFLARGWRLAPTLNEDNHRGHYGEEKFATRIWTNDLSRDGILSALRARRVYATENRDLELKFWLENAGAEIPMGAETPVSSDTLFFRVEARLSSRYGVKTYFSRVQLIPIKRGENIKTAKTEGIRMQFGLENYSANVPFDPDVACYYVRLELGGGKLAFSAPIWIGSGT